MNKKLLYEFISRAIITEDVDSTLEHNLKMIKVNAPNTWGSGDSLYNKFKAFLHDDIYNDPAHYDDYIKDIVASIPTLTKTKIKRPIGRGRSKYVFILENNHVFIIMRILGKELDVYKKFHDSQFSGKGSKNDPAIYEFGKIKNKHLDSWAFVEMSQVVPLNIWMSITGRGGGESSGVSAGTEQQIRNLGNLVRPASMNTEDENLNQLSIIAGYGDLTKEEVDNIYNEFTRIVKEHGYEAIWDMHIGNLGIMPQHDNTIVVFDID